MLEIDVNAPELAAAHARGAGQDAMEKVLLIGGSGLVGQAVAAALRDTCRVVSTAGHHETEHGYRLPVENTALLLDILERENPDTVISSLRGDGQAQMVFHAELARWLAGKDKRLLYISTVNVFDGDLSRPWTEADPPVPESDYGVFKRDCETMLSQQLGKQLTIFRLATVWDSGCPRIQALEAHSRRGEPHHTYPGNMVNITYAKQIGAYAKYVLEHRLHGIFHVGTTDLVNYSEFENMVCGALGIKPPEFEAEPAETTAFQAVIPGRKEIPDELQMTVAQVLELLRGKFKAD